MLNANIPNPLSMWLNIVASIDSGYLVKVLSCVLKICPPTSKVMIESDIGNYIESLIIPNLKSKLSCIRFTTAIAMN